jgi:hypothetical protein
MTKRPRAHELETESRRAFQSSLPSSWIFRDISPDYGIDGMVEIFDSQGNATGKMFFVQLKSTDQKTISQGLNVRLSRSTFDYYNMLVLPILIVVFHAFSKTIYAKWVTEYYKVGELPQSKTILFSFSCEDEWNSSRFPMIIAELQRLRDAKHIGERSLRIERYFEYKKSINLTDRATISARPVQHFKIGDRVFHPVFGLGVIKEVTDYYTFIHFDEDKYDMKFYPGDIWELIKFS